MNLVEQIHEWQDIAKAITPPDENIKGAKGRHPGIVFFPEGLGLQNPKREASDEPWPDILVIGHNFGTLDYLEDLKECGEEHEPTWRNLSSLLGEIEKTLMNRCFMTNWFIGFKTAPATAPAPKQTGEFLADHTCTEHCSSPPLICPHRKYTEECRELLIAQIRTLRPRVILLLGQDVIRRVHQIAPADSTLRWKNASKPFWRCLDTIRPVAINVYVPGADIRTNLVALTHPSHPENQAHRGRSEKGMEFKMRMKKGRKYEKAMILEGIEKACVP